MTTQLHDTGEEFETKVLIGDASKPSSVDVGLFHDGEVSGDTAAGDDLTDSNDVGDITTEPSGAAYSRQSVTLDTSGFSATQSSGDWQFDSDSQLSFDLSDDGSGTLDAYFVVVNYQADGDGSKTDHLYFTGNLSTDYDLSNVNGIDIDAGGIGRSID